MNNDLKLKNYIIHFFIAVFIAACFFIIHIFLNPVFKYSSLIYFIIISAAYLIFISTGYFINKNKKIKCLDLETNKLFAAIIYFVENKTELFNKYVLNEPEFENKLTELKNIENKKNKIIHYFKDALQKYNFGQLNLETKKEIDEQIKELTKFFEEFQTLEKKCFEKIFDKELSSNKNSETQNFILEYKFLSELNMDFLKSISSNVTDATDPLTNEIFEIKKNVSEFLNKIIIWDKELENTESDLNYNNVLKRYGLLINALNELEEKIENYHNFLTKNLGNLKNKIDNIYNQTGQINEIAAKIKILALNASIEAARAGDKGSGFKIIAVETQKLSDGTQVLLKSITENIKEAEDIVQNTNGQVNLNCIETKKELQYQKNESESFHEILSKYYTNYITACNGIQEVSKQINLHIDKINPVFQTHDIIVQQANNIAEIINKINKSKNKYINKELENIEKTDKNQILKNTIQVVEKQITTDDEVTHLGMQAKKYNIEINKIIEKGNSDIEFF